MIEHDPAEGSGQRRASAVVEFLEEVGHPDTPWFVRWPFQAVGFVVVMSAACAVIFGYAYLMYGLGRMWWPIALLVTLSIISIGATIASYVQARKNWLDEFILNFILGIILFAFFAFLGGWVEFSYGRSGLNMQGGQLSRFHSNGF